MADLLLRADGGSAMGSGHVMRCIALAEAWREAGGDPAFIMTAGNAMTRGHVERRSIPVWELPGEGAPGDKRDMAGTRALIGQHATSGGGTWVCLDGYSFDLAYQREIRGAGHPLLILDDAAHLHGYEADVLLNQNVHASTLDYQGADRPQRLLGTGFALLRNDFLASPVAQRAPAPRAIRVLITCGAADLANLTMRVFRGIEAVAAAGIQLAGVVVAVGPSNPHLREIQAGVGDSILAPVTRVLVDPPSMKALMNEVDLAVSAAGSTAWELCYMGVPTVLLEVADNQRGIASGLAALGAAVHVAGGDDAAPREIAVAVRELAGDFEGRSAMSQRAREVVDGAGRQRVVATLRARSALFAALGDHTLTVAAPGDGDDLLTLANDPGVRANSLTPTSIPPDSHARWFADRLTDPDSCMYVVRARGRLVAQIRYDLVEGAAEVNFSVDASNRGRGVGTRTLDATMCSAAIALQVRRVRGLVLPGNAASRRAFEKAGFRQVEDVVRKGRTCNSYELDLGRAT